MKSTRKELISHSISKCLIIQLQGLSIKKDLKTDFLAKFSHQFDNFLAFQHEINSKRID